MKNAQATLKRLDWFSRFTDSNITVPFTRFKIGVESLIGLIPGVGDIAGLILSSYVLFEAYRLGASRSVKRKIVSNILIDFVVGLIPIVGDIFDMFFKANTRNTQLLKDYINKTAVPNKALKTNRV
ncbi:DUF4112 domain-containing protein [Pseudoalteromonas sp. MMG010]|uniref:DUF4112 domain-containing protein n=1 Tax=Pseudoalteromonas sp. MMG010 TaxID=2822685 RepID=UPI001B3A362A|nr:DUF4112 domain-containing protein [Pseudoalteromonas sp. MMG010]MBQ4831889.1 DUF4112 domain-containing protein [Pseudoalteromonas sp. MMG010]